MEQLFCCSHREQQRTEHKKVFVVHTGSCCSWVASRKKRKSIQLQREDVFWNTSSGTCVPLEQKPFLHKEVIARKPQTLRPNSQSVSTRASNIQRRLVCTPYSELRLWPYSYGNFLDGWFGWLQYSACIPNAMLSPQSIDQTFRKFLNYELNRSAKMYDRQQFMISWKIFHHLLASHSRFISYTLRRDLLYRHTFCVNYGKGKKRKERRNIMRNYAFYHCTEQKRCIFFQFFFSFYLFRFISAVRFTPFEHFHS